VDLDVDDFHGRAPLESMDAFAGAVCRLLDCKCDCNSRRSVKTLGLRFHLSAPNLSSIGRAVEDTVTRGHTECLEFEVIPPTSDSDLTAVGRTELGQQFMSFSHACPIAFRWLTGLFLKSLKFRAFDLQRLVRACEKLKVLYLTSCRLVKDSVLKIDVPNSVIEKLQFFHFRCKRIDLVSVPKLTQLECFYTAYSKKTPLLLGYVPELRKVELCSHVKGWKAPFALSDCFSINACNLSELHLYFNCRMVT
jgi:hypothetical protein